MPATATTQVPCEVHHEKVSTREPSNCYSCCYGVSAAFTLELRSGDSIHQ